MNNIKSVTIFCPSLREGGTTFLYGRIAKFIKLNSEYKLTVIDFENGFIKQFLLHSNIAFTHILFNPKFINRIEAPTILIVDLLTSKLLGQSIHLNPKSCLFLVSTFPFDGFKYIPTATIVYTWSKENKRIWAKLLHPLFRKRVKRFLDLATKRKGLAYMDWENYEVNKYIFDLQNEPEILPIFTEVPFRKKEFYSKGGHFDLVWLGRLTDFKYLPICAILDSLEMLHNEIGNKFTFHIIGDGKHSEIVKEYSKRCKKVEVIFYGHLSENIFNDFLLHKADIVIGHGTSILEAAKLGVPSLLVNGAYFQPKVEDFKGIWLYDAVDYFVGKVVAKPEDFTGNSILQILKGLNEENVRSNGKSSFDYWNEHHNIEKIGPKYLKMIDNCSFTFEDYLKTGVTNLDFLGSVTQGVKNIVSKYRK